MTESIIPTPKVFISYSWTSPQHESWVVSLAERLVSDGVDVVIDKWNLKEGQDLYSFMESMVRSADINKVLIVLDKKYSEKADNRVGGVGTETQIISSQVYNQVEQEKFIPLVTQVDENNYAYRPTYLASRVYINFSNSDQFESSYETLLRNIYQRPVLSKPRLGKAPNFLFEDTPVNYKTAIILRSIGNVLTNHPLRINSVIDDFLNEFLINLTDFKIKFTETSNRTVGKQIIDNITQYTPLRNDFVAFFDKIAKSGEEFGIDIFVRFFEKIFSFTQADASTSSFINCQFDNYKFIVHELFLYMIAVLLKNERYDMMADILLSRYFINDRYRQSDDGCDFSVFYDHIDSIDTYYNETQSRQLVSPMASFMVSRVPENMTKDLLVDGDIVCFHVGQWHNIDWFPILYIYKDRTLVDFFRRFISQRHFEKVKALFNVTNAADFTKQLNAFEAARKDQSYIRYSGSSSSIIPMFKLIDAEKVATTR